MLITETTFEWPVNAQYGPQISTFLQSASGWTQDQC